MTVDAIKLVTKSQALQLLRLATRVSDGNSKQSALISVPRGDFYKIVPLGNIWVESNGSSIPPKCGVVDVSTDDVFIALDKSNPANPENIAGMSLEEVQGMRNWVFAEEVKRAKQEDPSLPPRP